MFTLLYVFCSSATTDKVRRPAVYKTYDIIFDLDWTALYSLPASLHYTGERYLNYGGESYRIVDWFEEAIQSLLEIPGVRISIFTGGSRERSEYILQQIILPDGSRLADRIHLSLAYHDMALEINPKGDKFFDKHKKDLSRFFNDLKNTIIVDDQISVPQSQRKNLLWLQETYNFYVDYKGHAEFPYDPPSLLDFNAERNKIVWTFNLLKQSLNQSKHSQQDLTELVYRFSRDRKGKLKKKNRSDQLAHIYKTIKKFRMKYGKKTCANLALNFD